MKRGVHIQRKQKIRIISLSVSTLSVISHSRRAAVRAPGPIDGTHRDLSV